MFDLNINNIKLSLCLTFLLMHATTCITVKKNYEVLENYEITQNISFSRIENESGDNKSALNEFPEYFTLEQLRQGWIVLHVFAAIYFFIFLAIICNDYFLPTVECICEDLYLSKDVAAATFMATATSMPEFFTNTVSTLLMNSDIGLGTIIGSLMFNTLGVASLAAFSIKKPIQLDWWPIARDCFIYIFNTVILIILIRGRCITFIESCIMMGFLILYYFVMFNNKKFMPAMRIFIEDKLNCCFSTRYDFTEPPENSAKAKLPLKKDPLTGNGLFIINLPENTNSISSTLTLTYSKSWDGDEESKQLPSKLLSLPHDKSKFMKIWWALTFPIKFLLSIVVPHPIKHRKFYPITFIMCIVGIGLNAYLIVWMLTELGDTIYIPVYIMGLTFLAAGSTMPEAVSTVISFRNGENGIGVSNSLGANSLAILLSLGVPWFIQNCLTYNEGNGINISAPGIEYRILILILCTISLFMVLSCNGYRLNKRVGLVLFVIYVISVILQIVIEFFFKCLE